MARSESSKRKAKTVFIGYPISANPKSDVAKIIEIVRMINVSSSNIVPMAPYVADIMGMNFQESVQKKRLILNILQYFWTRSFAELWLFGDVITDDYKFMIATAAKLDIPIIAQTDATTVFMLEYSLQQEQEKNNP